MSCERCLMKISLRVCRHCRKPVALDAKKCPSCHKALLNPTTFKATLAIMVLTIFIVYTALFLGFFRLQMAKAALKHPTSTCAESFYSRAYVGENEGCLELCTTECGKRGSTLAKALPITASYSTDRTDVLVSCECTCGTC